MLEIGIQSAHWYKSTDPTGSFRFIKECGFEAVDFNMDQYINVKKAAAEGIYPTIFDGDTAEVLEFFKPLKEASEETGVIISQMHAPFPVWFKEKDEVIYSTCRLCSLHQQTSFTAALELAHRLSHELNT